MNNLTSEQILAIDRAHIWHPYASIDSQAALYPVKSANRCTIELSNGTQLLDGMSSWWSAIHGYNHPTLNAAIELQLKNMSHIMFGSFTHEPAARLAKTLVELTPKGLERVFFSDSGSVSVEVALKMAVQYWLSKGQKTKTQFMSLRSGYHGDTLGAMSVCDPVTGMHHLFSHLLPKNIFIETPAKGFDQECQTQDFINLRAEFTKHHKNIAAIILEPIVQGAGGMRMYAPQYLTEIRALCDEFDVLLIADEIATGFGRTGELFACNHANVSPDILCLGKALTGGYLTLAATLCTDEIAQGICDGEAQVFMHGPTFMANPLACAVASASIELLQQTNWQERVLGIQTQLKAELIKCSTLPAVNEVRVLGAIGVVELVKPVDINDILPMFVEQGVWVRPFGKLVYIMPPYIISSAELSKLTNALYQVVSSLKA